MGYVQFLAWVAKQGLKNKVLQKYLNKAWQEGAKGGKEILKSQWPKLLKKAQDFYKNYKIFEPKIVLKTKIQTTRGLGDLWPKQLEKVVEKVRKEFALKPKTLGDALKTGKFTKVPTPKNLTPKTNIEDLQIGPHIDKQGRLWQKFVKPKPKGPAKIIPFPKKPPTLKADGGSIDKALPKRSRDI